MAGGRDFRRVVLSGVARDLLETVNLTDWNANESQVSHTPLYHDRPALPGGLRVDHDRSEAGSAGAGGEGC